MGSLKITMSENLAPPEARSAPQARKGVPLWMPLLAMLAAFALAVFVGTRIGPTLSGLLFPPNPPLPPMASEMKLLETPQSSSPGYDEWLYSAKGDVCKMVDWYKIQVGGCEYDMDATCWEPNFGFTPRDGSSFTVATCQGRQNIGIGYRAVWTIRIGAGYDVEGNVRLRISREVGN
jgi:hypothetical protein